MTHTKQKEPEEIDYDLGSLDQSGEVDRQESSIMATLAHQLSLFTWFIGPLFVYFLSTDSFAKKHALQSISWQANLSVYIILSMILAPFGIAVVTVMLFAVINSVLCVIGSLKAINGELWEYPISVNIFD